MERRGHCRPSAGAPRSSPCPSGNLADHQLPFHAMDDQPVSAHRRKTDSREANSAPGERAPAGLTEAPTKFRRRVFIKKFAVMTVLFLLSALGLILFYRNLPGLSPQSRLRLSQYLPSSLGDTSKLREMETVRGIFSVFAEYKEEHPVATLAFLSSCYLLYQAFPLFMITFTGTSTLVTILLGALFSPFVAFCTANALAATGPSLAFFMFRWVGKPVVLFLFPEKLKKLQKILHPSAADSRPPGITNHCPEARRGRFDVDLFLTVLFLRISPVFPNLFINAAAPLLEVPFDVFFTATLLGLMPNTVVFVSMGSALTSLDSLSSSWRLWVLLCLMAGAVTLVKVLRNRLRPRSGGEAAEED
ncbi:snare associated golgi protein [Cystoisospora suis]|uniref:Snare associated golgi protein n=1 Tax=Cystoisospora suis TaxID=483139 RepID=A0A2C6L337_9APIC|nr:snare associated golgi protein [Cystoisospora suis]